MWFEADVEDDVTSDDKSYSLGIEVNITEEQITTFNDQMSGKAFICHKEATDASRFGKYPARLIYKHYAEEDPNENLAPLDTKAEATEALTALWKFVGNVDEPKIELSAAMLLTKADWHAAQLI